MDTRIETSKKPTIWFSTVLNRLVMTANPSDVAVVLQAYLTMSSGRLEAPSGQIYACRYCLNGFFSPSNSLATIPNSGALQILWALSQVIGGPIFFNVGAPYANYHEFLSYEKRLSERM